MNFRVAVRQKMTGVAFRKNKNKQNGGARTLVDYEYLLSISKLKLK